MDEQLLSMDEAAEILGAHRTSLYSWIRQGLLDPPIRVGARKVAYRPSTIQHFIDTRQPARKKESAS